MVSSTQKLVGDENVARVYSDAVDELVVAARLRHIPHGASQQGLPQTNDIIEREVQGMLTGARTVLVVAGLPGYVRFGAAPRFVRLDKCQRHP